MNICLICRNYYPCVGGIETSIYQLSRVFAGFGHDVTIVTASSKPESSREEYAEIIYVPPVHKTLRLIPAMYLERLERKAIKFFAEHDKKKRPDLIIGRDSLLTCAAIKYYSEVPILYIPSMDVKTFAGTVKKKCSNAKQLINRLLEPWTFKVEIEKQEEALYGSTHNIVFCEGMRKQLEKSYHERLYRAEVCYPGCTIGVVKPEMKKHSEKMRLLFVGRISPEKNLRMLLRALSYVKEDLELTIVGDGPELLDLKQEAAKLDSNIRVNFEGYRTDVVKYYMDADFFVLPSTYESFGQVIIESFTCGVPVIGFSSIEGVTNTAVEELVTDYETGLICRNFTDEGLASCIAVAIELKRDREKKGKMDLLCTEYAKNHCSWNHLANVCLLCEKEENRKC